MGDAGDVDGVDGAGEDAVVRGRRRSRRVVRMMLDVVFFSWW